MVCSRARRGKRAQQFNRKEKLAEESQDFLPFISSVMQLIPLCFFSLASQVVIFKANERNHLFTRSLDLTVFGVSAGL